MIIIKLKGGLGNQLFQYAFGRLLSIKNRVEVKYRFLGNGNDTQREYKLDYFNAKVEIASDEELEKTRYPFEFFSRIAEFIKIKILRQFNIGYVPGFEETICEAKISHIRSSHRTIDSKES